MILLSEENKEIFSIENSVSTQEMLLTVLFFDLRHLTGQIASGTISVKN